MERMNRQELTEEAIKEVKKKREKEGESSGDEAARDPDKRRISLDAFRKSMDRTRDKDSSAHVGQSAYP